MKSLRNLYNEHQGKVSYKWELYLDIYDRIFLPFRHRPIALVEIGVQNGGSLEIWPSYFANGVAFVGCDIDSQCLLLRFTDSRISFVHGDLNTDACCHAIFSITPSWDIFIDDGSHRSQDIIMSFINYFRFLKPGGIYVVEDLHCAYWASHGGGIVNAVSSMNFFKMLCDMLNVDHWQSQLAPQSLFASFFPGPQHLNADLFSQIMSVTFYNSMCVIEKRGEHQLNQLGEHIIVGNEALVDRAPLELRSSIQSGSSRQ